MKQSRLLYCLIFSLLSFSATAQWAWTDEQGRPIFSDRAPASNVPDKRIFKRPAPATKPNLNQDAPSSTAGEPASAKAANTAQPAASTPQAAGIDKELAERKKKAEQAQTEQRKHEEERISNV